LHVLLYQMFSAPAPIGANDPNPTKQIHAMALFVFSRSQQIFPAFSIGRNQLVPTGRFVWDAGTRQRR